MKAPRCNRSTHSVRRARRPLAIGCLAPLLWLATPVAIAAPQASALPAAPEAAKSPRALIEERKATITEELAAAKKRADDATAAGTEPTPGLVHEIDVLGQTLLTLGQQTAVISRQEEINAAREATELEWTSLSVAPVPERASFLELEAARTSAATSASRIETAAAAAKAAREAFAAAQAALEVKEAERRRRKELVETGQDPDAAPERRAALRDAELESRLATEVVDLRDLERSAQTAQVELLDRQASILAERVRRLESVASFSEEDLEELHSRIATEEYGLKKRLDSANFELVGATARLATARASWDGDPASSGFSAAEAARLAREKRQVEVTLLGQRLQRLSLARDLWTRRYKAFNELSNSNELIEWRKAAQAELDALELDHRLHQGEIAQHRRTLTAVQGKEAATEGLSADERRWLRDQSRHIQEIIRLYDESLSANAATAELAKTLIADIDARVATVGFGERWRTFADSVRHLWNYEITSVDDKPITVAKVVVGVLLLMFGMLLARWLSRFLGNRLLPRFGVDEGAAAAVQSVLFYGFLAAIFLLALRVVNVPLTAFTILGGAFAIGVGFGSQNLMNNFISGLILLVERPIRVGDLITVGDLVGVVTHIGARSTRVKKPSNVDMIVPNSTFLETNVINWTLTDDTYRTSVTVGVAYGSTLRDVAKLIRLAVEEHGRVLKAPAPTVLFTSFGDNSLNFEVHFWIRMRREMDRRIIESDIRYRIDGLFRDAGIVIAFPQRDVHLGVSQPIPVYMTEDGENPGD